MSDNDKISESLTGFYEAVRRANGVLRQQKEKIDSRKKDILSALDGFSVPEPPEANGEYQSECRAVIRAVGGQISKWKNDVTQSVQREEFVNRHEESVMVIAFADVKAGKSSLGNFISGWDMRDTPYGGSDETPQYYVEEFSAASQEDRQKREIEKFQENEVEATSTIQYFTLKNGLTWVDTPGLHSLTVEHGELTREYVQFADLVLFMTPSNSPFKEDERELLGELLRQGKPVVVVITKSDITKRTVRDGHLVTVLMPKSPENRRMQEEYVSKELRQLGHAEARVMSISVKLAREALTNRDEERFKESGLGDFLAAMGEILSEKAMELKMRRPKTEINARIDGIIQSESGPSLESLKKELTDKAAELDRLSGDLDKVANTVTARMQDLIALDLQMRFRKLRDMGKLGDPETVRDEVRKCVAEGCGAACEAECLKALKLDCITLPATQIALSDDVGRGHEITYETVSHAVQKRRDPKNGLEKFEKWFLKTVFDVDKEFYDETFRQEKIPVGDNFSSFVEQTVKKVSPVIEKYTKNTVDGIEEQYLKPISSAYLEMSKSIESLAEQLKKLKYDLYKI